MVLTVDARERLPARLRDKPEPTAEAERRVRASTARAAELVRRKPRRAAAIAAMAASSATAAGLEELAAEAQLLRGNALRSAGDHEAALLAYATARTAYQRLGQPLGAARARAATLDSLRSLGRFPEAMAEAKAARRTFQQLGDEVRLALMDVAVGLLWYQRDQYRRALRHFDAARPILVAAGRVSETAALDNNAASALLLLDRLDEAEALFLAARATRDRQGATAAVAGIDVNLAYLDVQRGRYGAALDRLLAAVAAFSASGSMEGALQARLDLLELYLALNLLEEAQQLAMEAQRHSQPLRLPHEGARLLFLRATLSQRLSATDDATRLYAQAGTAFRAQRNIPWQARCTLALAAVQLEGSDGPEEAAAAVQPARRAVRQARLIGAPGQVAASLSVLARAHLACGKPHLAIRAAREALTFAERAGSPAQELEALCALGAAHRLAGQPMEARDCFARAAGVLEWTRNEVQPPELRMALAQSRVDVYAHLVGLALAEQPPRVLDALAWAQRGKSRVLAESLAGDGPAGPAADRSAESRRRAELGQLYARLEAASGSFGASSHQGAVQRQLRTRLQRLERELAHSRRLAPATARNNAPHATSDPAGVPRLDLPAGTLLLDFAQADSSWYAFSCWEQHWQVHRLADDSTLAPLLDRLDFQLGKLNLGQDYVQQHLAQLEQSTDEALKALYEILLAPIDRWLEQAQQVVILPFGRLHELPFHALLDAMGRPLIERMRVSYAPSLRVLQACLARPSASAWPHRPAILGASQPDLPQIGAEVAAMQTLFEPASVCADQLASTDQLRAVAPTADLLHLAAHAAFRADNPSFSGIRLADDWLLASDVPNLELRARLVTLSACQTGVSGIKRGDELLGFTRALLEAGASSLVVSHWSIDDASAANIMAGFYRGLRDGLDVAEALRQAQLAIRKQHRHPLFWAPFSLVGRPW